MRAVPASATAIGAEHEAAPPREPSARLGHMPQLDALRAFAVSVVLVHHYTEELGLSTGGWPLAANLGVKLFFVLSGFLITGILLRSRNAAAEAGQSGLGLLRTFYIRRSLRIFPLYYLVLGVAFAFNAEHVREYIGWLASYTLNFKMAGQGWYLEHVAHFWSLSVEEQFYVFWPWVVVFLPRRWLIPAAIAMVSVGPLFRLYYVLGWLFFSSEAGPLATYISTPACLDTLGMGALLALVTHSGFPEERIARLVNRVALPVGVGGLVFLLVAEAYQPDWLVALVLQDFFVAFVFASLIYAVARGVGGIGGSVLNLSPLHYVGKVSYGVYVYHPLVPTMMGVAASWAGLGWLPGGWSGFALYTAVTMALATASWYAFEGPVNRLKERFT